MDFISLCTAGPKEYQSLGRQVALCAGQGRSYEFPVCHMPRDCLPDRAVVGFCRREGGYMVYWRPAVSYRGENRVLKLLFARSAWRFDSFEDLTRWLHSLAPSLLAEDRSSPVPPPEAPQSENGVWPSLYLRLRQELSEQVMGQMEAVEAAAFRLYTHVGKQLPARPLSLIFYGPTGVGKSELGKAVAPALRRCCGQSFQSVWTELNTFTQPHSVHRLTGAPPGYVGYEDSPIFEAVRQNPRTVFMFDELEKAHPEVLRVFMSILDEGRCTAHRADDRGQRELDFRQCVFLFTTNADLREQSGPRLGFCEPGPIQEEARQKTPAAGPEELAQRLFTSNESARKAMVRLGILPEIAGRFSGLIGFHPLDEEARLAITVKQIQNLGREYGLQITAVDPALVRALTPGREALSARSSACVLESILAPLFSTATQTAVQLAGTRSEPKLIPAQPTSYTFPLRLSRL